MTHGRPTGAAAPNGHSSLIALDWAGTYSGVLPCASCPGIETVSTLNGDGTLERSMLYIDESPVPQTDGGTFTWNDTGSTVVLGTPAAEALRYRAVRARSLLPGIAGPE